MGGWGAGPLWQVGWELSTLPCWVGTREAAPTFRARVRGAQRETFPRLRGRVPRARGVRGVRAGRRPRAECWRPRSAGSARVARPRPRVGAAGAARALSAGFGSCRFPSPRSRIATAGAAAAASAGSRAAKPGAPGRRAGKARGAGGRLRTRTSAGKGGCRGPAAALPRGPDLGPPGPEPWPRAGPNEDAGGPATSRPGLRSRAAA